MFSTDHLHPLLVHFPIALILAGFLAELLALFIKKEPCFSKTGFYLLIIGAIAALVTYLSGQFFTGDMSGAAGEVQEKHELFGTLTLITVFITALFRIYLRWKKMETGSMAWTAFGLYLLAALLVSITGFLGGTLVYNYMMPL